MYIPKKFLETWQFNSYCWTMKKYPKEPNRIWPAFMCLSACVCVSYTAPPWSSVPSLDLHKKGGDAHTDIAANRLLHYSAGKCSWVLEVQPSLPINSWSASWGGFGPCQLVVPQRLPRHCSEGCTGRRHFWYPASIQLPLFEGWRSLTIQTRDVLATWLQCQSICLIF